MTGRAAPWGTSAVGDAVAYQPSPIARISVNTSE